LAERRMFAKTIIDSDAFLDMPLSAQCLYFHLNMWADDDGFINNPKKIQRMIGASDDDFKRLIAKHFVITFESGIIVIKHWKMHNYIQSDRYKPTVYIEEKARLEIKTNKAYTLTSNALNAECIQDVSSTDTQVRLGKNNIDISSSETADAVPDKEPLKKKSVAIFLPESEQYQLASFLAKKITERIPGKSFPERTVQSWAADMDKLNRLDGHTWDDIASVLDFGQTDSFWQTNILSGGTFRKQYDKLYLKMQKEDK